MRSWLALLPLLAVTLFVACYKPSFGSPGYYCDPENEPACPEGQSCVAGRCVSRRSGGGDMAVSEDTPDLKNADLKSVVDMKKPPDLTQVGGVATCGAYVDCVNACPDTACAQACVDALDSDGYTKISEAINCGYDYCQNFAAVCECDDLTGECYDSLTADFGACQTCIDDALSALSMQPCSSSSSPDCAPSVCASAVAACFSDT